MMGHKLSRNSPTGWGGGIGDCEINIVAKRINPPYQQQIIIKHAYEKMLLKTFSFGTQIRTFTNSNDISSVQNCGENLE